MVWMPLSHPQDCAPQKKEVPMFHRFILLALLVTFVPAAVGAQEIAVPANAAPPQQQSAAPSIPPNLMPAEPKEAAIVLAANDLQGGGAAEEQRPRKTHSGLTFQEFVEVHFGEYRWIYWAVAGAALIAIHAN